MMASYYGLRKLRGVTNIYDVNSLVTVRVEGAIFNLRLRTF